VDRFWGRRFWLEGNERKPGASWSDDELVSHRFLQGRAEPVVGPLMSAVRNGPDVSCVKFSVPLSGSPPQARRHAERLPGSGSGSGTSSSPCPQAAAEARQKNFLARKAPLLLSIEERLARKPPRFDRFESSLPARLCFCSRRKGPCRQGAEIRFLQKPLCRQGAGIRSLQNGLAGKAPKFVFSKTALPASLCCSEPSEFPCRQGGIRHPVCFALPARLWGNSDAEIFLRATRARTSPTKCVPSALCAGQQEEIIVADNQNVSGSTTPAPAPVTNADSSPTLHRYREAYERAAPSAQALKAEDLITINIDIPTAVTTAVGALPQIMTFRDKAAALNGFDASAFDQLETYTFATGVAHTQYMGASAGPAQLVQLNEQAMALRNTLYADAVALATRGLISGDRIGEFKANIGYKNLAFDLMALSGVIRQSWDKISSKTAITLADLDQADLLCDQIVNAVGTREQAPTVAAESSTQRQRHFTLFVNAYDQVRRAISFLRWDEDDLESIAPSLYAGRGARRAPDAPQPAAPTPPAPGGTTTGATPTAPVPATPAPTNTTHAPAAAASNGLPGASPFAGVS
jgi:hypothetical protein